MIVGSAGGRLSLLDPDKGCLRPLEDSVQQAVGGSRGFFRGLPWSVKILEAAESEGALTGECIDLSGPVEPPVKPEVLWGVGRSFPEHAREMGMKASIAFFVKSGSSVVGHMHPIILWSGEVDYEGEVALVVGGRLRHASPGEARKAVAGYTAANDATDRGLQRSMSWSIAKSLPTFGPIGPAVRLIDAGEDLASICVETLLNDVRVQRGCLGDMVEPPEYILARLSSLVALRPGDVVLMGTPPGVGASQNPPRYLRPGDTIEVRVSGLPPLVNKAVSPRRDQG